MSTRTRVVPVFVTAVSWFLVLIAPSIGQSVEIQEEATAGTPAKEPQAKNAQRQALVEAKAQWEKGLILVDGHWLTPRQAAEAARQDKRLAEYRKRRDAAGATVEDQAALARWCKRNKLPCEERVHWLFVRLLDPDNAEAIKGLGLHPYPGAFVAARRVMQLSSSRVRVAHSSSVTRSKVLLTNAQIEQIRADTRAMQKATERWRPLVARWATAFEKDEQRNGGPKLDEARDMSSSSEILALEKVIWQQLGSKKEKVQTYEALSLALVAILRDNPRQPAVESLARHAAFSSLPAVKKAAIAALKERPWDRYVPLLILSMGMPIDEGYRFSVSFDGSLEFRAGLWQDGPVADISVEVNVDRGKGHIGLMDDMLTILGPMGRFIAQSCEPQLASARVARASQNEQICEEWRADLERRVAKANEVFANRSQQIREVLVATTAQDAPTDQMSWWDWWQKYNELSTTREADSGSGAYSVRGTPEAYSGYRAYPDGGKAHVQYSCNFLVLSCFARGTKVWTLTGPQTIETIKPGDRVLSQDPDSGELAFKPVFAVTYRPPSGRLTIDAGGEKITTTFGHPFWVAAEGWRMAKELKTGSRLQGLERVFPVASLDRQETPEPTDEGAFNLVVADFNTYFVGEHLLLVHDNTPRLPPAVAVPALLRRAPAASAAKDKS